MIFRMSLKCVFALSVKIASAFSRTAVYPSRHPDSFIASRITEVSKRFVCSSKAVSSGMSCKEKPALHTVSMRGLLYCAIQAAERGGNEVRQVLESGDLGVRSKSVCYNPVTYGDMRSHLTIQSILKQTFPFVTVVSEEDSQCLPSIDVDLNGLSNGPPDSFLHLVPTDEYVPADDVTVWVDPLDGTQEYTEGLCQYVTTMIGIAVKGVAVAGVIHQPFSLAKTYWAWKNHGMCDLLSFHEERPFQNGKVLKLAMSKNPCRAGSVYEFSNNAFAELPFELIPLGGAGFKSLQVLLGAVDGYLHVTKNIKKWDICAGHGIINAMDGRITGLHGEEIDYSLPVNIKQDMAVGTGFICALKNRHQLILSHCSPT